MSDLFAIDIDLAPRCDKELHGPFGEGELFADGLLGAQTDAKLFFAAKRCLERDTEACCWELSCHRSFADFASSVVNVGGGRGGECDLSVSSWTFSASAFELDREG